VVKTAAEVEKGQPYGGSGSRYVFGLQARMADDDNSIGATNVATSSAQSGTSSSQANSGWGLSSLYRGMQLRIDPPSSVLRHANR